MTTPGSGGTKPLPPPAPTPAQLLKEALEAKHKGDLELAFTKYIAVLLKEPQNVEAHWGLAWVLASKGEKEAAVEHFQAVAELSDDSARVKEAKAALARLKAGGKP
jgi:Tfp pilus assembly protein PilF